MSHLVCENCGSHALSTVETTHSPNSGRELHECEECGAAGTLKWDSSGMELSGCLGLFPSPNSRHARG